MITLIIVIIVQALIIAVSIKKGIKQLNRAKYWKGQYIDASYRYKLQHEENNPHEAPREDDEFICLECGQYYPITGDADMDDRIRRTQEHNNNKSKLEDEIDELKSEEIRLREVLSITRRDRHKAQKLEDEIDELKRKARACICDNKYCHCLECQEKYNNK